MAASLKFQIICFQTNKKRALLRFYSRNFMFSSCARRIKIELTILKKSLCEIYKAKLKRFLFTVYSYSKLLTDIVDEIVYLNFAIRNKRERKIFRGVCIRSYLKYRMGVLRCKIRKVRKTVEKQKKTLLSIKNII
jgi:hypothetical protein